MDRNQGRRMAAEEKLGAVEKGRQSEATISEVCWRHQIHHTKFYRCGACQARSLTSTTADY
jgi:transposase-like protein